MHHARNFDARSFDCHDICGRQQARSSLILRNNHQNPLKHKNYLNIHQVSRMRNTTYIREYLGNKQNNFAINNFRSFQKRCASNLLKDILKKPIVQGGVLKTLFHGSKCAQFTNLGHRCFCTPPTSCMIFAIHVWTMNKPYLMYLRITKSCRGLIISCAWVGNSLPSSS